MELYKYNDTLQAAGLSGTATLLFVVEKDGSIKYARVLPCDSVDIKPCLGPETKIAEVLIQIILKSPNWSPAYFNHRPVRAFRKLPITYKVDVAPSQKKSN